MGFPSVHPLESRHGIVANPLISKGTTLLGSPDALLGSVVASPILKRRGIPSDKQSEPKESPVAMVISTLRILTAPKSRAEVVRTLTAQLGPTRVQPGCHRCDLYQDVENRETITLVEEWESQAALDLRLRSEGYRSVLAAIELAQEQPVIHFDTVTRRGGLEIVASARGA